MVSLSGFTIGITADRRWDEQAALFERRGASVLHGPTIRTGPLVGDGQLRDVTESIIARPPDVLVANTGIGIRSWFSAAESWGLDADLLRALSMATIHARGPKASAAVVAVGLPVASRAGTERLREAVDLVLEDGPAPGTVVAVQLDGSGASDEVGRLRTAGVVVVEVPPYVWTMPTDPKPALRLADAVISGRVHAVTFTAGPAARNFLALADEHGRRDELVHTLAGVVVGCVGPVCAEAARDAGIAAEAVVVPARARLGPLVRAVGDALEAREVHVPSGAGRLVLRGTRLQAGDHDVDLTDVEARLFAALARRPGAVLSKPALLREVWGDATGDPHVVEVTVSRLRRRLGPHGRVVAAVPRRGYTLNT